MASELTTAQVDAWLRERGQIRVTKESVTTGYVRPVTAHPFPGNRLRRVVDFHSSSGSTGTGPEPTTSLADATVVTSEMEDGSTDDIDQWLTGGTGKTGMHRLVIDVDHPVKVIPSSTPGHSHLYVDVPVTWDDALDVLYALARAGIVEEGYVEASRKRGYTAVRLPWVHKADPRPEVDAAAERLAAGFRWTRRHPSVQADRGAW